jgi:hypothetical protein
MKLLLLSCLFLSGCSLIKINESPAPEPHESVWLGVTEIAGDISLETRVRRSSIITFYNYTAVTCMIVLEGGSRTILADLPCSELELEMTK